MTKPRPQFVKSYYVRSRHDKNVVYEVRTWSNGTADCECIGFGVRRKCVHATYVVEHYIKKLY